MLTHTLLQLAILTILSLTTLTLAAPPSPWYEKKYRHPRVIVPQSYYEVLRIRASAPPNPHAVTDVVCLDPNKRIVSHDELAASLAICGGIAGAGASTKCTSASTTNANGETVGRAGTAQFVLKAVDAGAKVTISKERWVQCARAAREACPTGSMVGVCRGGASKGDVGFTLSGV